MLLFSAKANTALYGVAGVAISITGDFKRCICFAEADPPGSDRSGEGREDVNGWQLFLICLFWKHFKPTFKLMLLVMVMTQAFLVFDYIKNFDRWRSGHATENVGYGST